MPLLARETGAEAQARTFSPWSHVVSLIFAQISHAIGLNDVCDALRLSSGPLSALRGATPPSRNNLSHANKHRDASLAQKLFWKVLEHLQTLSPEFVRGKRGRGITRRFRRVIHLVDSTTIQLVASCMDWAKHRRRKAAAKCHLRLDLQSFLPRFVIIDTARDNDARRAREVCAGIQPGEIVIFDKAYLDFAHLFALAMAGIHSSHASQGEPAIPCLQTAQEAWRPEDLARRPHRAQDARLARSLSRADAAGRGAGGSRGQGSGDGVLD